MKLIIQNNRIAGTATDTYSGPDDFTTAPEDYDHDAAYEIVQGKYVLLVLSDAERRAAMPPISPLQGILTLGETRWNAVLEYRDRVYKDDPDPDNKDGDPMTPWAQKVIIDNAADWVRTSQNVGFIGYLLEYTDEEMDALFIDAALVTT